MNKLKAIEHLLDHGSRFDEWAEAQLLHKIEKIVKSEWETWSSYDLRILMKKVDV